MFQRSYPFDRTLDSPVEVICGSKSGSFKLSLSLWFYFVYLSPLEDIDHDHKVVVLEGISIRGPKRISEDNTEPLVLDWRL